MHWHENIPVLKTQGASIRLFAGQLEHEGSTVRALAPPTASWATNPENGVTVLHIVLEPNGEFTLPPTAQGHNRRVYFFEGAQIEIDGQSFNKHGHFTLDPVQATRLRNPHNAPIEVLVLGGKPINEPVAQRGPFVMNTMREIQEAFTEYQLTQFGGWPYSEDAVIFPRERGRFSNQKGVDEFPPSSCK
jgi:redox-sensitive bicupin YhaK (pirin superfamily)